MLEATANRLIKPEDVKCPAGVASGDVNVHCNIEGHLLVGYLEPDSVDAFCCGAYESCSTWMAMKKAEDAGYDLRKVLAGMQDENREKRQRQNLREARLRRAQRLMVEDSPEGKQFRKLLKIGEFDEALGDVA